MLNYKNENYTPKYENHDEYHIFSEDVSQYNRILLFVSFIVSLKIITEFQFVEFFFVKCDLLFSIMPIVRIILVILVWIIVSLFCVSACSSWCCCCLSNVFVLVLFFECDLFLVCCVVDFRANHLNGTQNMKSHPIVAVFYQQKNEKQLTIKLWALCDACLK